MLERGPVEHGTRFVGAEPFDGVPVRGGGIGAGFGGALQGRTAVRPYGRRIAMRRIRRRTRLHVGHPPRARAERPPPHVEVAPRDRVALERGGRGALLLVRDVAIPLGDLGKPGLVFLEDGLERAACGGAGAGALGGKRLPFPRLEQVVLRAQRVDDRDAGVVHDELRDGPAFRFGHHAGASGLAKLGKFIGETAADIHATRRIFLPLFVAVVVAAFEVNTVRAHLALGDVSFPHERGLG